MNGLIPSVDKITLTENNFNMKPIFVSSTNTNHSSTNITTSTIKSNNDNTSIENMLDYAIAFKRSEESTVMNHPIMSINPHGAPQNTSIMNEQIKNMISLNSQNPLTDSTKQAILSFKNGSNDVQNINDNSKMDIVENTLQISTTTSSNSITNSESIEIPSTRNPITDSKNSIAEAFLQLGKQRRAAESYNFSNVSFYVLFICCDTTA